MLELVGRPKSRIFGWVFWCQGEGFECFCLDGIKTGGFKPSTRIQLGIGKCMKSLDPWMVLNDLPHVVMRCCMPNVCSE